ncbi:MULTISPECIES: DNA-processing protein DprA [unclassified Actinomyces]|uniref:DNA-processing protein DprA n=1 Tax=unclassified Actinomyces TaxID=2609248 RepID=UPI000D594217|nr:MULTISPECIES: DNA-processing protein DprA [unclassified Actinomyces]RAX20595.1 DNA-processing protein DprA [Actinomyces sp. Z3]RAX22606.1 DNA-processing protein DprA [Actinomyces sp. Z5]
MRAANTSAAGSTAHVACADPPPASDVGVEATVDGDAEALARATWSRLAEPADAHACALVGRLGATAALDWLTHEALDADGEPRPAPRPPLPPHGDAARASADWATAAARWAPRLQGLDIRRELDVLERLGGSLLIPTDPGWPTGLNDLERPPHCLWVRGDPALLVARRGAADVALPRAREDLVPDGPGAGCALALVGARASTDYGEHVTFDMASGLAAKGVVVVSGGAFGIDAAAHRGALRAGVTVSVSAGGVDRLYPAGNADVLEEVIATGALVAEVPPGCQPGRHRFLTRNRLIAAMSDATVVVEAAWRSGALSTAHHALEVSRPVGAVPGPVTSMASVGCHRLLRQGAVCVTDADEALELVAPLGATDPDAAKAADPANAGSGLLDGLDGPAAVVLDALPARAEASVESIVRAAGLTERETIAALGLLELEGRVERRGAAWRRARGHR